MAFKTFVDSVALPASDLNTYLMKQAVIVCTAGTRPSGPVEGMTIYETDTDQMRTYDGATWQWVGGRPVASCRAYRNAALNLAAATSTTLIAMDTESWDVGGNFSTATGRFTAPDTGKYLVSGAIDFNSNNNPDEIELGIFVNATIYSSGGRAVIRGSVTGDDWGLTVSDIVSVTAGDVIDLRALHNQGGNTCALNVGFSQLNYISIVWMSI